MVDRVVADGIAPADRTRERRVALHEMPGEEERCIHVLAAQRRQHLACGVGVSSSVERQRDDMLPRLQADELSGDDRRRQREHHESTSNCNPSASANALWARCSPKGISSSSVAFPDNTSPYVTRPIETSLTIGAPSELGIAIASGLVLVSFGPPSGCPRRGGEVDVRTATSPPF